jgi:outer membrane receptor protein involved in Fe transport
LIVGFSRSHAFYERHPTKAAFNGAPLVATPDVGFSVWGKYAPHDGPLASFSLAAGVNYVGRSTFVANNPLVRLPPYATADATIGYRFSAFGRAWRLELTAKNIFNKHYYVSASSWGFPRHGMLTLGTKF